MDKQQDKTIDDAILMEAKRDALDRFQLIVSYVI